jgi:hypothetical protein
VSDLEGELLDRGGADGERRQVLGVHVALDDLRGDGRGLESEARADPLLHLRVEVRERADRAADLADRDGLPRPLQPQAVAPRLVVPEREGEAEGGRLGVDAVRAPDLRRVAELEGAAPQDFEQRVRLREQQVAGVAQQQGVRRVHHVRRGEPVVDEARGLADVLGERRGEGDDVVVGRLLDLADALDGEGGARLDLLDGRRGDRPHLRVHLADGDLHVEPLLELVPLRPERAHLGQRVP